MFIPDAIERVSKSVSYKDIVKDEPKAKEKGKFSLFGRKKAEKKADKKAA